MSNIIAVILLCLIGAAFATILFNVVLRPILVKRLFNSSATKIETVTNKAKAIMFSRKFPWYCDGKDFYDFATKLRHQYPDLEFIGAYDKYDTYVVMCEWWKFGNSPDRFNLEKLIGEKCQVAAPSCAIFNSGTTQDQAFAELMKAFS